MKIALICRRYHPEIGGVETHVREIAERLAKKHEVIVFTLTDDKRSARRDVINEVTIQRFRSIKFSYSLEIPPMSMVKAIERFSPDIIHSHNIHTSIPYFTSHAKAKSAIVITPHYQGNPVTKFRRAMFALFKPFITRAMQDADLIVCVSTMEKKMLENIFRFGQSNSDKIAMIPNGVQSELTKIVSKRGSVRILSVARLDLYHKKTDKLLKAFSLALASGRIDKTARLVLVGNGPDREKIINIINNLGIHQNVQVKSNISKDELVREYSQSSIFVTASENEAFGIAVAEALAARLSVVVPYATGLSSYVDAGYARGIELPVTPEKIAAGIISCITHPIYAEGYTPYTWDRVASELERQYYRIASQNQLRNVHA